MAALTPSSPPSAGEDARDAREAREARETRRLSAILRCDGVSDTDLGREWACWKRALLREPYPENFNPRPTRRDERDFALHVYPMVRELTNAGGAPLSPVLVVDSVPRTGGGSMRVLFDAHAESRRNVRVEADITKFKVIFDPPDSRARAFRFVYKPRTARTERSVSNWQFVLPLGNFVAYSGLHYESNITRTVFIHSVPARLYRSIGISAAYEQAFTLYRTEFWRKWLGFVREAYEKLEEPTLHESFHSKEHVLTGEGKTNDDDDDDDDDDAQARRGRFERMVRNGDYVIAVDARLNTPAGPAFSVPAATGEDEKAVHICEPFLNQNDFKRLKGIKDRGEGGEDTLRCCICYQDTTLETHRVLSCGHFLCSTCVEKIKECPLCRVPIAGRGKKRKRRI